MVKRSKVTLYVSRDNTGSGAFIRDVKPTSTIDWYEFQGERVETILEERRAYIDVSGSCEHRLKEFTAFANKLGFKEFYVFRGNGSMGPFTDAISVPQSFIGGGGGFVWVKDLPKHIIPIFIGDEGVLIDLHTIHREYGVYVIP
jgi:hypothetical protein